MTQSTPEEQSLAKISAESIVAMDFPATKYGRGYDQRAVREFVERIAWVVGGLQQRLQAAETEVERLQKRADDGPGGAEVLQAVSIISTAQRTADSVIAEANSYSARVMSEAHAAYDDARRRSADLEHRAEERVRRLALTAKVHQDELDQQTAYLRTLRDATRTQMQKFLEGMLFHVADEYGRAHPIAAHAAEAGRTDSGASEIPDGDIESSILTPHHENGSVHNGNGFASVAGSH